MATFTPSSIAANSGQQTVGVNIQTTAGTTLSASSTGSGSFTVMTLALLLLPVSALRRFRSSGVKLLRLTCLTMWFATGVAFAVDLTGCGSHNGYFGQPQKTYTVTITATSGTVQHSTNVTLIVE